MGCETGCISRVDCPSSTSGAAGLDASRGTVPAKKEADVAVRLKKEFMIMDLNENGCLDLAEWLKYKREANKASLAAAIFSSGIDENMDAYFDRYHYSSGGLRLLFSLGEYLGIEFVKNEAKVKQFLDSIADADEGVYPFVKFGALPSILRAGIKDTAGISNLISACKSKYYDEELPDYEYTLEPLLEILKFAQDVGISDPAKIVSLSTFLCVAASEEIERVSGALPGVKEFIEKMKVTDPDEIIALIEAICTAAGERSDEVFSELGGVGEVAVEVGIGGDAIVDLIKKICGVDWYAVDNLRAALYASRHAGLSDPDEIVRFLEEICTAAGRHTWNAFEILPEMSDAGIMYLEIPDFIRDIRDAVGERVDLALLCLKMIFNAGIKDSARALDLVKAVHMAAGDWSEAAFRRLGPMLRAGITDPSRVFMMTEAVWMSVDHGTLSEWASEGLSKVLRVAAWLGESGIPIDPDVLVDLVRVVCMSAGRNSGRALTSLSEAMCAFADAGIRDPDEIAHLVKAVIGMVEGGDSSSDLRSVAKMMQGEGMDFNELYRYVKGVMGFPVKRTN